MLKQKARPLKRITREALPTRLPSSTPMRFQPVAFGLSRSDVPEAHLQEKPVVTTGEHLKQVLITLPKYWSSIDAIGLQAAVETIPGVDLHIIHV